MSWEEALERPGPALMAAAVRRLRDPGGPEAATREALEYLAPRIGWADYGPRVPLGLVGLRAVWRLREVLSEVSFHRALVLQLAMAAREGRGATPLELVERPLPDLWPDMATLGFKPVFAQHFKELECWLGGSFDPLIAHLAERVAPDTYWNRLAGRKLEAPESGVVPLDLVETLLEGGVVETMACMASRLRTGQAPSAFLEPLVEAACYRLLDAERDLAGKTSWLFVYLAALGRAQPADPRPWFQAAALVNFFPGEGRREWKPVEAPRAGDSLLDAILDGEPQAALNLGMKAGAAGMAILAEAATQNDPAFHRGRPMMALAAALDLVGLLSDSLSTRMTAVLAKFLASSLGGCEQALLADRLLGVRGVRPVQGVDGQ